MTAEAVCRGAVDRLEAILGRVPGGLERFLDDGPIGHPRYQLLARELRRLHSLAYGVERRGSRPRSIASRCTF